MLYMLVSQQHFYIQKLRKDWKIEKKKKQTIPSIIFNVYNSFFILFFYIL